MFFDGQLCFFILVSPTTQPYADKVISKGRKEYTEREERKKEKTSFSPLFKQKNVKETYFGFIRVFQQILAFSPIFVGNWVAFDFDSKQAEQNIVKRTLTALLDKFMANP